MIPPPPKVCVCVCAPPDAEAPVPVEPGDEEVPDDEPWGFCAGAAPWEVSCGVAPAPADGAPLAAAGAIAAAPGPCWPALAGGAPGAKGLDVEEGLCEAEAEGLANGVELWEPWGEEPKRLENGEELCACGAFRPEPACAPPSTFA